MTLPPGDLVFLLYQENIIFCPNYTKLSDEVCQKDLKLITIFTCKTPPPHSRDFLSWNNWMLPAFFPDALFDRYSAVSFYTFEGRNMVSSFQNYFYLNDAKLFFVSISDLMSHGQNLCGSAGVDRGSDEFRPWLSWVSTVISLVSTVISWVSTVDQL